MKRLSFLKRLAAARARKRDLRRTANRHRVLQMENLDSRALLVGDAPSLDVIANVTVKAGAPLIIPINASDPDSGPLTFSASVPTGDAGKLSVETPNNNRSLRLVVAGYGEMWFELFEDKVPGVTSKIIELVQSGKWNNTFFHRIIDGFMAQGGAFTNSGAAVPGVSNFDDQYHLDLQHTSSGLLSMAKSTDDTNSSQFFITDVPTRFLDFNHSVFGRLVKGESVRNAINNATTISPLGPDGVANTGDEDNRPITDVVITSATIFSDDDNGVMYLKAPTGQTGTVTVTAKVTDSDGNFAERTFTVTIVPDDSNGAPFLNPVTPVFTTTGNPVTFQLSSSDSEPNDPRTYSASKPAGNTVNYTLSFNANGQVTVTPPAGFVGTFQVLVSVTQSSSVPTTTFDPTDAQLITVNVRPTQPTLTLLAASDSGIASNDGITNATGLQFAIGGLTTGATINLYRGNDLIETVTAAGANVNLTTTKFDVSPDGTYDVKVTQTVNNVESLFGTYTLKIDRTGPAQVNPAPPTEAIATKPYNYDAANAEEGTTGFRYSLANPPAGMTINELTGVISWTPSAAQVGSQTFGIVAKDAAGNQSARTANVNVGAAPLVQFILKVTDSNGNVLTSIANGQSFELRVFTKDLTPEDAAGVFSAYMDVTFDSTMADAVGSIIFGDKYPEVRRGNTTTPGLIDEVGAIGSSTPVGTGEVLLFRQAFTAKKSGLLTFASDPNEQNDSLETLRYFPNTEQFPTSRIDYGTASITVDPTATAVADTFNVNEDSTSNTLTPLTNDTVTTGTTAGLLITAVGTPSQGGTVTIAQDGKSLIYTPAPNFNGGETFTYTITNTDQSTSTAVITMQVQPQNDPPTAVNDTFSAVEDVALQFVPVLSNDLFTPDSNEVLKVTAVGTPSQGGTAIVAPNGSGVQYTPKANFVGTETFTYTISDGNGGTATATVTVTVSNANDAPVALADNFTVAEDSDVTNLNPLVNDNGGANDTSEVLTITAVGTPSQGGTVTISSDNKTINYKPKANFQGTETFTYTISDGNNGTATSTITMTVTNVNDNPIASPDAITVGKDSTTTLDLLKNDSFTPDPTETLTITEVTGISNNGSVTIAPDGKTVSYKPAAGYTGTETFTYKISDGNGGTATAVATITILNFVPSKISGRVFFDANSDGLKQGAEVGIGGIKIRIQGTSEFSTAAIDRTITTDSLGRYTFDQLPPGAYQVTQVTMNGLSNTRYHVGTQGGAVQSGAISVDLVQDVESLYNDFIYEAPRQVGVLSTGLFASSARSGFVAAASPGATGHAWNSLGQGWANYSNLKLTLANDLKSVTITGTQDGATTNANKTATIPMTNAGKIKAIKKVGDTYTFQVNGTAAQIFGTSAGSGEPGSSTSNRSAGNASGEPGSSNLSAADAAILAVTANTTEDRTENLVAKTRGKSASSRAADYLFASAAR